MAFLGSIGKALGLGTTQSLVTQITGSPAVGAVAGAVSRGVSTIGKAADSNERGQATAVDVAPPPAETGMSGQLGSRVVARRVYPIDGGGILPASFGMNPPSLPVAASGIQQAGLPAIITGGAGAARGLGGLLGLGGAAAMTAPIIIDQFGNEKKLRVTRRLRSQVKQAVEFFGVEAVAEQMGVGVDVIFYILTKKMRNDGPYVTKAAVRKTRQTIRKMKGLCDMYDDMRPAARRRAPARKVGARVTQIKN